VSPDRTVVDVDVTNLIRLGITTGVQRVVREVVGRLALGDAGLELRYLRYDAVRHVYEELTPASVLAFLSGGDAVPEVCGERSIHDFAAGEVFLDIDATWNAPLSRTTLYPALKASGVLVVSYVYDFSPFKLPDAVMDATLANWTLWLAAVLAYADLVLTDSRSAERDFVECKARTGVRRHVPTLVTRLGAELPRSRPATEAERASVSAFVGERYLLFVSTVEPRKRHLLALEAFDLLHAEHPDVHLVIAGRRGWKAGPITSGIRDHPLHGSRVHWVEGPSDGLLGELYEQATACVYLSRLEGYGLPIAEALGHGRVTLASRNSSMYEVAREACDYTWFDTAPEIAETLGQYLGDPALLHARERHARETFRPTGWDAVARTVEQAVAGLVADAAVLAARPRGPLPVVPAPASLLDLLDDSLPDLFVVGGPADDLVADDGTVVLHHAHDLVRTHAPDARERATTELLDRENLELLSYDHVGPRVVEKALLAETAAFVHGRTDPGSVDLWTVHANLAATRHPTRHRKVALEPSGTGDAGHLLEDSRPVIAANGLAHGALRFATEDLQVLVSGVPQLLTAESGSVLALEVSVQVLGGGAPGVAHRVELCCDVSGSAGGAGSAGSVVVLTDDRPPPPYDVGLFALPVPVAEPGTYEVELHLRVDGAPVYAEGIRYLAVLVVVAPGEDPGPAYRALSRR
jgi:glycosyltransferase involved in cell wall biosynthesis